MYMIEETERVVRIEPKNLKNNIDEMINELAKAEFEGNVSGEGADAYVTILVRNVKQVGEGRIVHGDPHVYQTVSFEQVVFKPMLNEIIEGYVEDVTKFGAFIRFGPMDGLLHVSQVVDGHVEVNEANKTLEVSDSDRKLGRGDRVRARITTIDLNDKNLQGSKIGLTMRQPGLGAIKWIEEDERKGKGEA